MKRILGALFVVLFVASCGAGYEKIDDYQERSLIYGWVDTKSIKGNKMVGASVRQSRPATKFPNFNLGYKKIQNGYLIYNTAVPRGAFKLEQINMISCLGILCGNTTNSYQFGRQGNDLGTVIINQPGIHKIGKYVLRDEKTGWFQPGEFTAARTNAGPSDRQLLEAILEEGPFKNTYIEQRIRRKLGK